jgi:hypothetical protein
MSVHEDTEALLEDLMACDFRTDIGIDRARTLIRRALKAQKPASQQGVQEGPATDCDFCKECKDEFGHPDNCIGCDGPPAP